MNGTDKLEKDRLYRIRLTDGHWTNGRFIREKAAYDVVQQRDDTCCLCDAGEPQRLGMDKTLKAGWESRTPELSKKLPPWVEACDGGTHPNLSSDERPTGRQDDGFFEDDPA